MAWWMAIVGIFFCMAGIYAIACTQIGSKAAATRLPLLFLCFAAALGLAWILIYKMPNQWKPQVWSALCILYSVATLCYVLKVSVRPHRRAGKLIAEIGRPRGALFIGVMACAIGTAGGIDAIVDTFMLYSNDAVMQAHTLSRALFYFSLGLGLTFFHLSGSSITTNGVFTHGRFIAWAKITSIALKQDRQAVLVLTIQSRFPWRRSLYISIPVSEQAVVEIIRQRRVMRGR